MPPPAEIDVNQVVAHNVRLARELRGWTQEDLADRLEPYLGQRLTQGSMSAIERAWEGERRREFDAQELVVFAMVFDLPVLWFLLPPPGDQRLIRATTRPVSELYAWLLGRPDQLEPLYQRLRQLGIDDPTTAEEAVEKISGAPSSARQWSYRQRRKELLLALLDEHGDDLDRAVDELGRWFDHLRQVGIRGFVAEHTNDADYVRSGPDEDQTAPSTTTDKATPPGTSARKGSHKKSAGRRRPKRGR
ncbi:MAG: helix-turn-helix domain-containing protein [Acidimicrobiia bacterium]